jgi:hypothetical protein
LWIPVSVRYGSVCGDNLDESTPRPGSTEAGTAHIYRLLISIVDGGEICALAMHILVCDYYRIYNLLNS